MPDLGDCCYVDRVVDPPVPVVALAAYDDAQPAGVM
jgi:hypothetical protein